MTTAFISHSDCLGHVTPPGAPERVARLEAIHAVLEDVELLRRDAPLAEDEDIARCHNTDYIAQIRACIPQDGFLSLDADTSISPGSGKAIWRAVGGAIAGVDAVLDGEVQNAFVAMRPPGHHAEQAVAMGFCIFGNVAIAAKHALDVRGLEKVAVVDFDVHHGNGTQALLQDDPRALVVTSQQMPLWPGTGEASDTGPHGTVVNLPLPPGSDGAHAIAVYEQHVIPALTAYDPDLILISAGFDAHQDDPLASLRWSADTFAKLTQMIIGAADRLCEGRVVSVLEGGYDLDGLGTSVRAHVEELKKAAR